MAVNDIDSFGDLLHEAFSSREGLWRVLEAVVNAGMRGQDRNGDAASFKTSCVPVSVCHIWASCRSGDRASVPRSNPHDIRQIPGRRTVI